MVFLKQYFTIGDKLSVIITAAITGGTITGAVIATIMLYNHPPKRMIIIGNLVSILGLLIMCASQVLWMFILGRFLFGVGLGSTYITALIYLSHWSPTRIRGKLMAVFGISSSCGQFLSLLVGQILVKVIFTILQLHRLIYLAF